MIALKKILPYLASIIIVITLFAGAHFFYIERQDTAESQPVSTTPSIDYTDLTFTECLEASHQVTAEGLQAREAAMRAFAELIQNFITVSYQKVLDCF